MSKETITAGGQGYLHIMIPKDVEDPTQYLYDKLSEVNSIEGVRYDDDTGFFGIEQHPNYEEYPFIVENGEVRRLD